MPRKDDCRAGCFSGQERRLGGLRLVCQHPVAVDAALAKRLPELENVNFRGGIPMWVPEIFQIDDPAAHMTWNSWHMGGIERKAIAQGFSFYSPSAIRSCPATTARVPTRWTSPSSR